MERLSDFLKKYIDMCVNGQTIVIDGLRNIGEILFSIFLLIGCFPLFIVGWISSRQIKPNGEGDSAIE